MQLEDNTLYYIYDPMCSWCYAFEHSFSALQHQLPAQLELKTILGGLAADSNTPMPIETQSMIQQAWQQIENTVPDIRFNFDFWTKNTPYRSTYPACRAVLAAANQSTEFDAPMRQAIQQAYYQDAKNPSLNDVLIDCAAQLALDIKQFSNDLSNMPTHIKLNEHRHFAQLLEVNSYPALRLVLNAEIFTIPIDYKDITSTIHHINTLLNAYTKSTDSPCVRNCCLDETDMCLGCFRLMDEITGWAYSSEAEKQAILDNAVQRKKIYNKNLI